MRVELTCPVCGSDQILFDAWARWDDKAQDFVLDEVYTEYQAWCSPCETNTTPKRTEYVT